MRLSRLACVALAGAHLTAGTASGQERAALPPRRASISIVAGVSQFDFSGAGRTSLLGLRADAALRHWGLLDGGLSFVRPIGDDGRRKMNALAELQAQVQLAKSFASPYLGVGAGLVTSFAPEYFSSSSALETSSGGGRTTVSTISSAVGVRFHPRNQRIVVRTELRVRGIDGFNESAVEWTLGVGRRF